MNKQLVDLCGCVMFMAVESPVNSTKQEVVLVLLVLTNISTLSSNAVQFFTHLW